MITKERLWELKSQGKTVYVIEHGKVGELFWEVVPDFELKNIFESYDDAKFVADNYCTRTERFEPPLWDEIGAGNVYKFFQPNGLPPVYICVSISLKRIYVENLTDKECPCFEYSKEGYAEAVEYAKKIFLGETK